jgi:transcriptional regulator with XRE-family HTH domain
MATTPRRRTDPRPDFRPENPTELYFLRQRLGWTQDRMARYLRERGARYRLACSTRAISYFENGDSGRVPPEILISLVRQAAGGCR